MQTLQNQSEVIEEVINLDERLLSENDYVIFLKRGTVIECIYKDFPVLDLQAAKEISKARKLALKMMKVDKAYFFVDMTLVNKSTTEARNFFDLPEETKGLIAVALYTESLISYVVGTFYLKLTSFKGISQKVFMNRKEGFDWLKSSDKSQKNFY